ncbi:MAG: HdeD family acid-resistance protein [Lachnospiraceae bacterium]
MKNRSGFGWIELITGILMIILGVVSCAEPMEFLSGAVYLYGIVAIVTGIADIIFAIRSSSTVAAAPVVSLITGTISLMAGTMLVISPGMRQGIIAFVFPMWFVAHCVSGLAHAGQIRAVSGKAAWLSTIILNVVGLILSFLIMLSPKYALMSANSLIGLFLIILGLQSFIIGASVLGDKKH